MQNKIFNLEPLKSENLPNKKEFDRFISKCTTVKNCIYFENNHPILSDDGKQKVKPKFFFRGQKYSPARISYIWFKGKEPNKRITRNCGNSWCLHPNHLEEQQELEKMKKPKIQTNQKRFTKEEIFNILDFFEDSNGTATKYCEENSIEESRLSRLKKRKTYQSCIEEYYKSNKKEKNEITE